MRNLRKVAGSFDRELTKFGDIVTADHVSFTDSSGSGGLNGEVIGLVVKDLFSGFLAVYPSDTKAADQVLLRILTSGLQTGMVLSQMMGLCILLGFRRLAGGS